MEIEYSIDTDDFEALKKAIIGLAVECPVDINPEDCQLHQLRKMTMSKRLHWVVALTHGELKDVYLEHKKCFSRKTQESKS
jgi:hypothetical protein